MSAQRGLHLQRVAAMAKASPVPLVVLGDLNCTPWSHAMTLIQTEGVLGYRTLAPAWEPTWYSIAPLAIPIDHVLCTAPLVVETRQIGPDLGSDHRSVLVDLRWADISSESKSGKPELRDSK
jgi:endonuclease/exonuclease/phosphatase (EEP) superfamily protein YafD